MISNLSSDLLSVLFRPLGILELEVLRAGSHKYDNGYDNLVLYGVDER